MSVAVVESFHNSGRITLAAWKGFQPSMGLVLLFVGSSNTSTLSHVSPNPVESRDSGGHEHGEADKASPVCSLSIGEGNKKTKIEPMNIDPQTTANIMILGAIGSSLSGFWVICWAFSKMAALAKQMKLKADNSKNPRGMYLWIAVIFWAMNLFFILSGTEVTRLFVFSCVLNVMLLQLIILGYIVKRWITYISNVADKN